MPGILGAKTKKNKVRNQRKKQSISGTNFIISQELNLFRQKLRYEHWCGLKAIHSNFTWNPNFVFPHKMFLPSVELLYAMEGRFGSSMVLTK